MNRFLLIGCAAAVLAVLAVAPTMADGQGSRQRVQLDRNVARWNAQHLRDYRFRLRVVCFCPDARSPVTITVRAGRPSGARAQSFARHLDTVPELFDQIRHALKDPRAGKVTARYDTRRGYPTSASIDRVERAIDDEIGWKVDRFRTL